MEARLRALEVNIYHPSSLITDTRISKSLHFRSELEATVSSWVTVNVHRLDENTITVQNSLCVLVSDDSFPNK
jgi:hypothetical protein